MPDLELQVKVVNPDEVLTRDQQQKTYTHQEYSVGLKCSKPWWWDEPAGPFAEAPTDRTARTATAAAAEMNAVIGEYYKRLVEQLTVEILYGRRASSDRPAQDPNFGLARALPESFDDE